MSIELSGDEKRIRMFKMDDSDFTSEDFLFVAFSILESQGYHNLIEVMSIIEDPKKIVEILYLLNGVDLKLPTASELAKALKTSTLVYMDTIKSRNITSGESRRMRPVFMRTAMNIDENEEQELLKLYAEWVNFMEKNGYSIDSFLPIINIRTRTMVNNSRGIKTTRRYNKNKNKKKIY